MKRSLLLSTCLLLTFCGVLSASSINGDYEGHPIVNVTYEGQKVTPSDVPAFLFDDRTVVPLDMLRKVGFDVDWNADTWTADIHPHKEPVTHTVKTLAQIEAMQDRIALIYGLDDSGIRRWQGSGFILNSHGLLITANHVLQDDKGNDLQLEVILNGKTYRIPKHSVAFRDDALDVAGIYLHDSEPFPYLKIGDLPKAGDIIYDIGYPNTVFTVFKGEASTVVGWDSSTTQPGSSGGASLNQYGEVIGVTVGGYDGASKAEPISEVMKLYQQSINQ